MISIKKYLDLDSNELNKYRPPSPEELVAAMLGAYRAALGAMGNSGLRACPTLGPGLQRSLMLLAEELDQDPDASSGQGNRRAGGSSNFRNGGSKQRSISSNAPAT